MITTGDLATLQIWSYAEISIGIVCGSLPPCRTFLRNLGSKLRKTIYPHENTTSIPGSASTRSFLRKSLSKLSIVSSRSQSGPGSFDEPFPTTMYLGRPDIRRISHDSGGSLLPLHHSPAPGPVEAGVAKSGS